MQRKQQLLKQHRQKKRLIMLGMLVFTLGWISLSFFCAALAWFIPLIIIGIWIIHEVLLADHLFYSAQDDYLYSFPENTLIIEVAQQQGKLTIPAASLSDEMDTLILQIELETGLVGCLFDPQVLIKTNQLIDRQDFERGSKGVRYINLSGLATELQQGKVSLTTKYASIKGKLTLYAFKNPDYTQQRIMVIAPHADDAELSCFGLYSQAANCSIITLTQGEIEAKHYQTTLKLNSEQAAQLKGRLRSWDSIAVPLWGGVPLTHSVQLGYYCMQLKAMHNSPDQAFASKESGEIDIRIARQFNSVSLPTDSDGRCTWQNLKTDLAFLMDHFQPEVIIMPHPELDPHEDHIKAGQLVTEVLQQTQSQPHTLLLYANHLHDNDRWPMGPANQGIALPPAQGNLPAYAIYSPVLTKQTQIDKAMALAMQHDLQPPLAIKKQLRRLIQSLIIRRTYPKTGQSEFFRKAVRRHELFWVKKLTD